MDTRTKIWLSFGVSALLLAACATRPMGQPGDPALVRGFVDGLLAPIAFVVSLFNDGVRMYAFPNVGRWYDFGFLMGLSAWGGGGAATRYIYVDKGRKN